MAKRPVPHAMMDGMAGIAKPLAALSAALIAKPTTHPPIPTPTITHAIKTKPPSGIGIAPNAQQAGTAQLAIRNARQHARTKMAQIAQIQLWKQPSAIETAAALKPMMATFYLAKAA